MSATSRHNEEVAERERRRAAEMSIGVIPDTTHSKWDGRRPDDCDLDLRPAWDEADPVHFLHALRGAVVRLHAPTDMLLIARQGCLTSTYPLTDRPLNEQRYVREQVKA